MSNLENTAELVAHYTSLSVACEFILPDRRLRFSPLRFMNDPRENKERMVTVGWSGDETPPAEERMAASEALRRAYLDYSKVFCGTIDAANPCNLNTKKCFGRPRMWAQYGGNHRGVCLVFDMASLEAEVRSAHPQATVYSDAVEYDDRLKSVSAAVNDLDYDLIKELGLKEAIQQHVEKFRWALYFRKDSDWIGESEQRWVLHEWKEGHQHVAFDQSLKAIVMGVDCPEVYASTIRHVAGSTDLFHLEWDDAVEDFYLRAL